MRSPPNKRLQLNSRPFGCRPVAHDRQPPTRWLTRGRLPDDTAGHTGRLQLSRGPLGG